LFLEPSFSAKPLSARTII